MTDCLRVRAEFCATWSSSPTLIYVGTAAFSSNSYESYSTLASASSSVLHSMRALTSVTASASGPVRTRGGVTSGRRGVSKDPVFTAEEMPLASLDCTSYEIVATTRAVLAGRFVSDIPWSSTGSFSSIVVVAALARWSTLPSQKVTLEVLASSVVQRTVADATVEVRSSGSFRTAVNPDIAGPARIRGPVISWVASVLKLPDLATDVLLLASTE